MCIRAVNPTAKPHLSRTPDDVAILREELSNFRGEMWPLQRTLASSDGLRCDAISCADKRQWKTWSRGRSSASYPVLCSGSRFGAVRRPAARRRSASTASPLQGLGTSRNEFVSRGQDRRTNFFRAPPRKHSLALGSRAHSLASLCVTRAGYGKFNERRSPPCTRTKSP
jgi:hypothetical protein